MNKKASPKLISLLMIILRIHSQEIPQKFRDKLLVIKHLPKIIPQTEAIQRILSHLGLNNKNVAF